MSVTTATVGEGSVSFPILTAAPDSDVGIGEIQSMLDLQGTYATWMSGQQPPSTAGPSSQSLQTQATGMSQKAAHQVLESASDDTRPLGPWNEIVKYHVPAVDVKIRVATEQAAIVQFIVTYDGKTSWAKWFPIRINKGADGKVQTSITRDSIAATDAVVNTCHVVEQLAIERGKDLDYGFVVPPPGVYLGHAVAQQIFLGLQAQDQLSIL